MSFKLLAIRPLEGCNEKFLKNLKPNQIYKFYDGYEFILDEKEKEVIKITRKEHSVPDNFFGENINISAIVGKNGSGKSSLVELFIVCINQLSYYLKVKMNDELLTKAEIKLAKVKSDKKINCEFYFEKDSEFYFIKIKDNQFENCKNINIGNSTKEFLLSNFFYTEVINYSIYAYNSWELGGWIDNLFHKNDSYQIPIVINPKRESKTNGWAGVIDVNNEQNLLKQRLLANILKPVIEGNTDFRKMGDNMVAFELELNLKSSRDIKLFKKDANNIDTFEKSYEYDDDEIKNSKIESLKKKYWDNFKEFNFGVSFDFYNSNQPSCIWYENDTLIDEILKEFKLNVSNIPDYYKLKSYLCYKVYSICEKYNDYKKYIKLLTNGTSNFDKIEFVKHIKEANKRSHITNKLMQVIHYIQFYDEIWKEFKDSMIISLEDLSKKLDIISKREQIQLIELLPPPIFDVDINLSNQKDNTFVTLNSLSSGEKQLIHSVSSVIYHLNNINSVKKTISTVKYDYVNIILDEIELYFHPEYQRKFVSYIIENIKNANLDKIKAFNILFITHSPFILSDIPKQNVLFLEVDEATKKAMPKTYEQDNTFAGNVHEMLTNGFFLENTIGEFARTKIKEISVFYEKVMKFEQNNKTELIKEFNLKKEDFFKTIELIGEDYIRNILKNHILEIEKKLGSNEFLQIRRKLLEKELESVNKQLGL